MSMFSFLSPRARPAQPPPGAAPAAPPPALPDANFAYPSVDPGIAVHSADDLLAGNADLMSRIKLAYGCDRETFERNIVRVARSYAQFVSVLPATPDNCFSEPGGLLRMGLEIGFYALQATDAQIFEGRATISSRVEIEPRWRLATFLAGLCGELHRTLSNVTVNDRNGSAWPSYMGGMEHWLHARKADRIYPKWSSKNDESRAAGVFALPHIIERDMMQYLATGNTVVVPHMLASISGMATYREHNVLDDLVRRATAVVIDANLRASAERYGKITHGVHLERYLLDAMRRLMATNASWEPNVAHSRMWYGQDGLYLVYPKALSEVVTLLENERLPGIPKAPETLLELLIDAGVVLPQTPQQATWLILPPDATVPYEALQLAEPAILLASKHPMPKPLPVRLAARAGPGRSGRAPVLAAPSAEHPGASRSPPPPPDVPFDGSSDAPPDVPPYFPPDFPPEASRERPPRSSPPDPDTGGGDAPEEEPAVEVPRTRFTLRPSLRLRSSQARGLRTIVERLNEPRQNICRTVAGGLFIPLNELTHNNVDYRDLASFGMLVPVAGMRDLYVHNMEFAGEMVNGVVLAARAVGGLEDEGGAQAGGDDANP